MKLGQPIKLGNTPIVVSKSDSADSGLVAAINKLVKAMTAKLEQPIKVAPVINVPKEECPTEWVFTHKYDSKGNIVETVAKARK